jgi:DNA-binding MarR family transcriptional regulator
MEVATDIVAARVAAEFLGQLASVTESSTLGTQQLLLLLGLYLNGQLNQNDLPRYTGVERSAVSRNLQSLGPGQWKTDPLTGKKTWKGGLGLIESERTPEDQRVKVARLSIQGRDVLARAALSAASYINKRE